MSRVTLFFLSFISFTALAIFAAADDSADSAFLSKTEFDAFVQQYRAEHSASSGGAAKSAWQKGKFTITPYGFINIDASYETDKTTTGDYVVWANSRDLEKDSGFNVDAKTSRLGLKVASSGLPFWRGSKTEGCVEFDFQGQYYASRNRAAFLLRKAYVQVSDGKTKLLAGQDWEVVSPLYPKTLNYPTGSCVGNLGYRRAMLRADHRFDFVNNTDLTLQFALCDNVYRDSADLSPASGRYPLIEGRAAYGFAKGITASGKPIILGISSHIGEERFRFPLRNEQYDQKYLKTWSFNVDFDLPITKKLTFQTEYFLGENLSTIEGGILQGVDAYTRKSIRAQGGWAGLTYQATQKLQTNLAFIIDDPFNGTVVAGNNGVARTYNHCVFGNVIYNWTDALMTGFEISGWRTHWQRGDKDSGTVTPMSAGTSTRYQFTVRYTF